MHGIEINLPARNIIFKEMLEGIFYRNRKYLINKQILLHFPQASSPTAFFLPNGRHSS